MKYLSSLTLIAWAALAAGQLAAAQPEKAPASSAELERMKSLAGTWKGTIDMGQGPMEITVEYRVVAGGSALEERTFAGTPREMVTMYHDKNGKLALTHYCMLGNQPSMRLKSADAKSLKFDFDPACGIKAKSETHMHSLVINFIAADEISQDWTLLEAGKAKESSPIKLKRVKA